MGVAKTKRWRLLRKLAFEPPFRLFVKAVLNRLPVSLETRDLWDLSDRPQYLRGVRLRGQAVQLDGVPAFSAIEFGVASGSGLTAVEAKRRPSRKRLAYRSKYTALIMVPRAFPS